MTRPLATPTHPCAYHVDRRMYCFQESLPASLPHPVCLLPPVTMTTLDVNTGEGHCLALHVLTKGPAYLRPTGGNIDIDDATVRALRSTLVAENGTHI